MDVLQLLLLIQLVSSQRQCVVSSRPTLLRPVSSSTTHDCLHCLKYCLSVLITHHFPSAQTMAVDVRPEREDDHQDLASNERKIWLTAIPIAITLPCLIAIGIFLFRRYRRKKAARDQDIAFDTRQRANGNAHNLELPRNGGIFYNHVFQHATQERSQSTPTLQISRPSPGDDSAVWSDGRNYNGQAKDIEAGDSRWSRSFSVDMQRAVSPKQLA